MWQTNYLTFALAFAFATSASASGSGFLLGSSYYRQLALPGGMLATALGLDGSNASYLLAYTSDTSQLRQAFTRSVPAQASSFILKQTPDGQTIEWLTVLGYQASAMAVDPWGSVYVAGPGFIAKLNPAGSALAYKFEIGSGLALTSLAVDANGRVYVAGYTVTGTVPVTPGAFQQTVPGSSFQHAFVLRLNAAGTTIDYSTYLTGSGNDTIWAVGVDRSGSAVVFGTTYLADFPTTPGAYSTISYAAGTRFLARFTQDGSALIYSTLVGPNNPTSNQLAVDPDGNATIAMSYDQLQHFNAQGKLTFSKAIRYITGVAEDTAGNVYVSGKSPSAAYPVKNSLFTCQPVYDAPGYGSTGFLTVLDPAGNVLQSTYLRDLPAEGGLTTGPDSVLILGENRPGLPFFLAAFAPDPTAPVVRLACTGNAASLSPIPMSGGELVSLFGTGLGPDQGVQPPVDLKTGVPLQYAGVQVTFNGKPAPLLYAQDSQVNAVAPWSLAGASTVAICVSYNGTETNCLQQAVAATAPGVFTTDGFYAAAINQDGTVNSAANPAAPGSIVTIFATGLGPINPPQPDGAIVVPPLPVNSISTQLTYEEYLIPLIEGLPVSLQYQGPAPYKVAGISQINFPAVNAPLSLAGYYFSVYVSGSPVGPPINPFSLYTPGSSQLCCTRH